MIKTFAITASVLAASAAAAPAQAQGTPKAGVPSQCFALRDIRSFAGQDDYTVNLRIGGRDVYQLKTIINCPDIGGGAGLSYRSSSDIVCDSLDLTLVTRTTRGPRECAVKSIRKLSPPEIAALPKRARP
jgi:hypothetical protein